MAESASSSARKRAATVAASASKREIADLKQQRTQLQRLLKGEAVSSQAAAVSRELRQINLRLTAIDTAFAARAADDEARANAEKEAAKVDQGVVEGGVAKLDGFAGRRGAGSSRVKPPGRRPATGKGKGKGKGKGRVAK